jgi:hypothetical protein
VTSSGPSWCMQYSSASTGQVYTTPNHEEERAHIQT